MKKGIEKIRAALISAEAGNLFKEGTEDLTEACTEFLRGLGYKVVEPFNFTYNKVKNIDNLIELFYALHRKYHPSDITPYRASQTAYRTVAKRFLDARMEASGLTKELALRECAEIIGTIFEFEDQFNFDTPVTFSMLGQAKLGWITDMAIRLLNARKKLRKKKRHEELQDHLDTLYDSEEDLGIGYNNLDEILNKIKESKAYGKEENQQ